MSGSVWGLDFLQSVSDWEVEAALNQTSTPTSTKIEMGLPPEGGEEEEEERARGDTEQRKNG